MRLKLFISIAFCLFVAATASANDTLDKLYSKMETVRDAKVTVSEERDPSTGTLQIMHWYITVPPSQTTNDEIVKAFLSQRAKAMKFRISENNFYSVEFIEDGNSVMYNVTLGSGSNRTTLIKRMDKSKTPAKKSSTPAQGKKTEENPDVIVIDGVTFRRVK